MRILVLGGDGMLGHRLLASLGARHELKVTLRRELPAYGHLRLFTEDNAYEGVDARDTDRVLDVLSAFQPEAIVNAAGIVKQRPSAKETIPVLEVNSLFPHRLSLMARTLGARMVHVSTDCVFSGAKGNYTEQDRPDPVDLYGYSKLLGEVADAHCITLRTSIIGLEVANRTGLVEWALAQRGPIRGFRRVLYSGLTTHELARVVERVLLSHPDLSGIYHIASQPISKYDLLASLFEKVGRSDVHLTADDSHVCDRTLCADAFQAATGYVAPSWDDMLAELAGEIAQRGTA